MNCPDNRVAAAVIDRRDFRKLMTTSLKSSLKTTVRRVENGAQNRVDDRAGILAKRRPARRSRREVPLAE
jgi:hypothetical protein